MPIGAIIGGVSGLLGAGASLLGSSQQASAANHAADLQMQMFQQTQKNLQPYMTAGTNALPGLNNALSTIQGGFNPADLSKTPGYEFTLQQGEQAIQDKATMGVGGGNTLKDLMGYATGLADQTYQQQFTDWLNQNKTVLGGYQDLVGLGENAAAGVGNAGAAAANNAGNYLTQGASASSAGLTGAANSLIGAGNQIGSNYLLASLMNGGYGGPAATYAASAGAIPDPGSAIFNVG